LEEWGDTDDKVLFKGLRVRMVIHVGTPKAIKDAPTRRVEYSGPAVDLTARPRLTALTHGGQILLSHDVYKRIRDTDLAKQKNRVLNLGRFPMPDSSNGSLALPCVSCLLPLGLTQFVFFQGEKLYDMRAIGLEARFYCGVSRARELRGASLSRSSRNHVRFGRELQLGGFLVRSQPVLLPRLI
jgi:hypothetical protein